MAKLPNFLADWRFILIYIGIAGGLAALIFWGGTISPIDRQMQSKGGSFSGGNGNTSIPKEGYQFIGNIGPTNFVYLEKRYATTSNQSTLRALGAAICLEQKKQIQDYCEIYFWTNKAEIIIEMPARRTPSLVYMYEQKDGKQKLKGM